MDEQNELYHLVELFSALYGSRAKKVADRLLELLEEGLTPEKAFAIAIQEIPLFSSLEKDIGDKMVEGAALGFGTPQAPEKVRRKLLDEYWAPDKMTLSKRLHGTTKEMRQNIVGSISTSMRKQETFVETARKLYDGYNSGKKIIQKAELPTYLNNLQQTARRAMNNKEDMAKYRRLINQTKAKVNRMASDGAPNKALKSSYQQLVQAAEELNKKALRRAVKVAIEEKSRYHAERIARTEIARAYAEGFIAQVKDDEDVVGIRWRLGSRHPKYDLCDFYAKTNLYGMGIGIFPKDRLPPFPAHPHCLCRLSKIYEWETETRNALQKKAGDDFLKSIPEKQGKELLGYEGYSKWKRGEDWRGHLRGWPKKEQFVSRLEKEDFGDENSDKEHEEYGIISAGALNPNSKRADEHAIKYYESVRHMKNDYKKIAQNTDWHSADVLKIKQYIFIDEHKLFTGKGRFSPDYYMARAWQRLIDGKDILESDYVLLNHEWMELNLVNKGLTQEEAHDIVSEKYNYAKALKKEEKK